MDLTNIEKTILSVMEKDYQLNADEIKSASIWSELGLDSLDIVELILKLEDEFGIEVEDDAAEKIKNYNALIAYLKGKYNV
jgi:acyl carrier protein